uniref:Predicted protein n=1 Tax=Physcomitrium patens TaxID=3218 RepID=A9U7M1_PHYPA
MNAFSPTGPNFRGRIESFVGPDGKPLCAVDHPYSPTNSTDVQSNLGTAPLTLDAWDDTAVLMQEWKDDRGNPLAVIPDTLIVAPYNARAAFKIAGLPDADLPKYEPGSNHFDANMYMGNIKVIVNPFIPASHRKNWFAADSARMKRFNHWQWRRKPENGSVTDFDTEVTKFKVVGRWGYGWTNYSYIFGHNMPLNHSRQPDFLQIIPAAEAPSLPEKREPDYTVFVDANGQPIDIGGGGGGTITSNSITDATATGKSVLTAANQAAARTAIGAGTSNLAIGTTASTVAAGNHVHPASAVTATAIAPGTATNVQAILAELAARITALENV